MGNHVQVSSFLAHWPLPNNFPTDNKVGTNLLHELVSTLKHIDPTVDTRIGSLAIPKAWFLDQFKVIIFLANHGQSDSQAIRGLGGQILAAGKHRLEIQGFHFDTLILHDTNCQHAIEAAGQ
jgi:hypothetical protein